MESKRIGLYARTSTKSQTIENQLNDLRSLCNQRNWKIEKEFIDDGFSGSDSKRVAFDELMDYARKGKIDAILVHRIDRFSRSVSHAIQCLEELKIRNIEFISYSENIDTSTPIGNAMFCMVSVMAQLEKNIIKERIYSGLRISRIKERMPGPKRNYVDKKELDELIKKGFSYRSIAKKFSVSKDTIRKIVKDNPEERIENEKPI